jgi:hypothetical protein
MLRVYSIVILVVTLAGCASVQTEPPRYESGHFPEPQTLTTVNVGQVMVTEYDYLSQVRATVLDDVSGSFWTNRRSISSGDALVSAISSGEQVYCQAPRRDGAPCLKDTNGDGHFDRAYTMNAFGMVVNGRNIGAVRYRVADQNIQDGFKYELIYQGIDGDTVRIAYREYTENLARPAFSQDLSYTLEEPLTDIRFRDVQLTIHEANNNQITYILESGF